MLTDLDREAVRSNFSVYEHDWTFGSGYLGEPFLIDDCLAYFDGRVVNFAAFKAGQPGTPISGEQICRGVAQMQQDDRAALLHVWGVFESLPSLTVEGNTLHLLAGPSDTYPGEYTIQVKNHDMFLLPEARKSTRAALNKKLRAHLVQREFLTSNHFRLIEEWVKTRPIALPSVAAMTSLPAYIRNPHVLLVEVSDDSHFRGFGVLSFPTPRDAVLVATFSEKYPGSRIEDILMHEIISLCKARDVTTLHLGYAGSDSLARFKCKWGATKTGPDYTEAIYADPEIDGYADIAQRYSFFWNSRMHEISASRD